MEILQATHKEEFEAAAVLFREYAAWLNIDLCFQHFDEELLQLDKMYSSPDGAIFLIRENEKFIGCVGVRRKKDGVAELKRMYVQPTARKSGMGKTLLDKAISTAKQLGYKKIVLDTLDTMTPAINLYKQAGFYETAPYYFNPESNALFFEKEL